MVNKERSVVNPCRPSELPLTATLVRVYIAVVIATLAVLLVLTFAAPTLATTDAWGHAIVVAVFAVLLPLRLRAASTGRRGPIRAVGLIAAVLLLVNVTEALIPGFVPAWMRVEMSLVAVLMAGVVLDVVRWAVVHKD